MPQITHPHNGYATSRDSLKITLEDMTAEGKTLTVNIVLDDDVVATTTLLPDGGKAICKTDIKLKYVTEGTHEIRAEVIPQRGNNDCGGQAFTDSSKAVRFIVDRTHPFVRSMSPLHSTISAKDGAAQILVDADDIHSGLDVERCRLFIDNEEFTGHAKTEAGLSFRLRPDLVGGAHEARLILFDMAGNKVELEGECIINETPSAAASVTAKAGHTHTVSEKTGPEPTREYSKPAAPEGLSLDNFREKLVIDSHFLKNWLKNPGEFTAGLGINYPNEIKSLLAPPLNDEYIDYSINAANNNAAIIQSLMARVLTVISKETPHQLERLEREGVFANNGRLTACAEEFILSILHDPVSALEDIGVSITSDEKSALFPPVPQNVAEGMARWISTIQLLATSDGENQPETEHNDHT